MKLMVIENNAEYARQYDKIGIDRIFIDLEKKGKIERQGHLDTVISLDHKISDIETVKRSVSKSKILVRVHPIGPYSKNQIDGVVDAGADIVMLPFFSSSSEVDEFLSHIDHRVKTCLLLETPQSMCRIDQILRLKGIDEIHIGLNDLHLGMGLDFMFEVLGGGLVDFIAEKIKKKGIPFGFGGIARLAGGLIPGKMVLKEHVRLNSEMVILSRSFVDGLKDQPELLASEIFELRSAYQAIKKSLTKDDLEKNRIELCQRVESVVNKKRK